MKAKNISITILFEGIFYFILMFGLVIVSARMILINAPVYVPSEPISLWYFLLMFALVTFAVLVLVRRVKSRLPFEVFLTFAIFAGVWFLADIWFVPGLAIGAALLVMLLKFIYRRIWWQNLVMVLGIAGIVVSIGLSIPWLTALIIMVLLSFYDIIAVYYTRHMVEMFKGLVKRGIIFALILPTRLKNLVEPVREVKPGENFMFLGTGDLALPGIMVATLVRVSLAQAFFSAVGAMIGFTLLQLIFFSQKRKKPMPALPPIAAMTIIGFLIAHLFGL